MNRNLLRIALDQLKASDWATFESLCSSFLASEFGQLRTMANAAGDGGRDSELLSPDGLPFVAAQYSVTDEWKPKIRKTYKRISETFPSIRILVYMSNKEIGSEADGLKKELLSKGVHLDTRDRNWFLERAQTDSNRETAAEMVISKIARPFLEGEAVIEKQSSPLTTSEARAALVYLGLQWQDDAADKGLTKLSFDALVRSTLRHTNAESRLTRAAIHDAIIKILPKSDAVILRQQIDSALARLAKRYIRHWQKEDEFCLTHEEQVRIMSRLADHAVENADFESMVRQHCELCLADIEGSSYSDVNDITVRVPRVLEKLLWRQGEVFATATLTGNLQRVGTEQLADLILADIDTYRPQSAISQHYPRTVATVIQSLLGDGSEVTRCHLKKVSNSYTLLTFLNQTPDVQTATRKLFSHGKIWVDTTVLLPVLAERAIDDEESWRFAQVIGMCADAGVEWCVTSGVIQEINAHMNNALICSQFRGGKWRGRVPYLYNKYIRAGRCPDDFRKWLSLFRGSDQPEEDLALFLHDELSIERKDIGEQALEVDEKLRWAAERLWTAAHHERRLHYGQNGQQDEETTRRLIQHDLETYLGVVRLRKKEPTTELGYRHWLLTLDRNAWDIRDKLRAEFPKDTPSSPLMSLSYLLNTITFGGNRTQDGKSVEMAVPLILDIEMSDSMSVDILKLADEVRRENVGLPEYVIRRKVKDAINRARRKWGCIQSNVFDTSEHNIGEV